MQLFFARHTRRFLFKILHHIITISIRVCVRLVEIFIHRYSQYSFSKVYEEMILDLFIVTRMKLIDSLIILTPTSMKDTMDS